MLLLGNMQKMSALGQFSPCVKFKVTKLSSHSFDYWAIAKISMDMK